MVQRRNGCSGAVISGIVLVTSLLTSCAYPSASPAGADRTAEDGTLPCREPVVSSDSPPLRWTSAHPPSERSELRAWCAPIGPPVVRLGSTEAPPLDTLVVVSWNVHVGRGDLARFLQDLVEGAFTSGQPVRHYVLLLQEAIREGSDVPVGVPGRGGKWIDAGLDEADRLTIEEEAAQLGLDLVYIPSMRNGRPGEGLPPEDRGNAILSNVPMTDIEAIVLPLARQRRVAVAATVPLRGADGRPWSVRLYNAHFGLETLTGFPGVGHVTRLRQAEALLDHADPALPSVIGGDLNSWSGGPEEPAVQRIARRFNRPTPKNIGTHHLPFFFDRVLDYILFDVPDEWEVDYRVVKEFYGSDHRPIVGWIHRVGG